MIPEGRQLTYDPSSTDEAIFDELKSADEKLTAQDIASAVDSTPNYVRKRSNKMADEGVIGKRSGKTIIGLEIPGRDSLVVLSNRDTAVEIIEESSESPDIPLEEMDLLELRGFVERRIATDRVPLPVTKNRYYYDESRHEGL